MNEDVDQFVEVRPFKMEKIKNIYLRRFLMVVLFPFYIIISWFITLCWLPFLYIIKCVNIATYLYGSMKKRWN